MAITIRGKLLPLPILQGGMGVGVSLDRLAGAVARQGGMGTISTALCGYQEPDFAQNPEAANLRALDRQVRAAKRVAAGRGLVAVNAMVATRQYADSVRTALRAGADAIVSGAGLPTDLPALAAEVPESDAALAPVVSSGRSAAVLCRMWDRRYHRVPDFIVLEGPRAGGHLGFSPEEARRAGTDALEGLLNAVLAAVAPYEAAYCRRIPVFVAGDVGTDMGRYLQQGAAGAQFATAFIATEECDASQGFKDRILAARAEDIVLVHSPVGMPGRALRSPLVERVSAGTQPPIAHCRRCLTPCRPQEAPYCISQALIAAVQGDWEHGLFFCGAGAAHIREMTTVPRLMEKIMKEWSVST